MTGKKAQLIVDGVEKPIELPVYQGSVGPDVIDVRSLTSHDLFTFDPGFMSTASCESKITYIDGDQGILLYRGYPIEQLAEKSDYLECCYLLLNGELINIGGQYAVYKRVSTRGDIRNNIHTGGVRKRTYLTRSETAACQSVGRVLRELGLWFVGLDMAGGKIMEINVFTPGGIHNINELYNINVGQYVIQKLENYVKNKTKKQKILACA